MAKKAKTAGKKKATQKDKDRHAVTVTVNNVQYAQVTAIMEKYNALHGKGHKIRQGRVATAAICLFLAHAWTDVQQMIDNLGDHAFWEKVRAGVKRRGPLEWPTQSGEDAETQGNP